MQIKKIENLEKLGRLSMILEPYVKGSRERLEIIKQMYFYFDIKRNNNIYYKHEDLLKNQNLTKSNNDNKRESYAGGYKRMNSRLENWWLEKTNLDPFKSYKNQKLHIIGEVYNHPTFEDGTKIKTAPIISVNKDNTINTETNSFYDVLSVYELGKIDVKYKCLYPDAIERLMKYIKKTTSMKHFSIGDEYIQNKCLSTIPEKLPKIFKIADIREDLIELTNINNFKNFFIVDINKFKEYLQDEIFVKIEDD